LSNQILHFLRGEISLQGNKINRFLSA